MEQKNNIYDFKEKIKEYKGGIAKINIMLKDFNSKKEELLEFLEKLERKLCTYNISEEEYEEIELECDCGKIESGRHHQDCPSLKNGT